MAAVSSVSLVSFRVKNAVNAVATLLLVKDQTMPNESHVHVVVAGF